MRLKELARSLQKERASSFLGGSIKETIDKKVWVL